MWCITEVAPPPLLEVTWREDIMVEEVEEAWTAWLLLLWLLLTCRCTLLLPCCSMVALPLSPLPY